MMVNSRLPYWLLLLSFTLIETLLKSRYSTDFIIIIIIITFLVELKISQNIVLQLQVEVHLSDGSSYEGEVSAFDLHYNIATVKFKPDKPPQKARLKWIDDSMSLQPDNDHTMVEANFFNLCPGDKVIALARVQDQYHHKLLVSSGDFRYAKMNLVFSFLLATLDI